MATKKQKEFEISAVKAVDVMINGVHTRIPASGTVVVSQAILDILDGANVQYKVIEPPKKKAKKAPAKKKASKKTKK